MNNAMKNIMLCTELERTYRSYFLLISFRVTEKVSLAFSHKLSLHQPEAYLESPQHEWLSPL